MWPSVAVTTPLTVWGYYFLLMVILIFAPCLLAYIISRVWYRPLVEREYQKVLDEMNSEVGSK